MRSRRVQNLMLDMRPLSFSLFLSFLFSILFLPSQIQAAPGDLDPAFGTGGIVTTPIGSTDALALAIAVQSDGKLVAAGGSGSDFALVRYNTDGSLDTTFGTRGIVTTPIGSDTATAQAIAIQPDGKLVAAGVSYSGSGSGFTLVRYNTDGNLDTTFGTGGIVATPIGSDYASAYALSIQSDGKLVAAGSSSDETYGDVFALVRYNTDGSLDMAFGTGGFVTTPIGDDNAQARALSIQSDGKLVAAGLSYTGGFALARYNTNGSLDPTFGTGGIVTTAIGTFSDSSQAYALAIQSNGKLVVAGRSYTDTPPQYYFTLVRYNTDGSLDTAFGTGGIVTTIVGSTDSDKIAYALSIQSDGRLVAAGQTGYNFQDVFALVRYNADGSLDTTFGTGGIVITTIGYANDAHALSIQSDGKLVAAGRSVNGTPQSLFALARYLGGLTITIPAGASSCVADYNGTCALSPNPLTITSGDSVVWSNMDGAIPHTATSDDHSDTLALDQPVAPANSFSTALIVGGTSSASIGPFITAVTQTKLYHCSLHPNMKGTLIILPAPPPTTTTTTTTTTRPTTTSTNPTTSTLPGQTTTTSSTLPTTSTLLGQTTTTSSTLPTTSTLPGQTTTSTTVTTLASSTTTIPGQTTTTQPGHTTTTTTTTTTSTTTTTTLPVQNHPPSADSLAPVNISTLPSVAQSFTAVYSDPDGYQNIADASLFISGNTHNETLHYSPATNKFTMMGVGGDCSPGQAATLSDGNLTLNCSASSASASGTMWTVTYNLTPLSPLSGAPYLLIITVVDQSAASNSKTAGSWIVNRRPSADSVTPMNSMIDPGMGQMFTAVYSDPDGWQNIAAANLYFSGNGGIHNEWLHYLVAPNLFTMMGSNDSCTPGQMKMLSNGYLTLDCSSSSISGSGNVLTVIFQVTPQMPSSGIMYNMFSAASDQAAAAYAIFAGTWMIN